MTSVVDEIRNDRDKGAKRLESEYKAGLMSLARRFCSDESDAEELVNRTFAIVVKNIDSYLEQSAFFGWMSRILINCHNKDVRRKSHETVFCDGEIPADAPDDDACAKVFREVDASLLRDAIERLPPDMKKTLMLHYFLDMPVREVARVLSVPSGTVMWRLHYTRQILGAKLGAQMKKPVVMLAAVGLVLLAGAAIVAKAVGAFGDVEETRAPDRNLETVVVLEERLSNMGEEGAGVECEPVCEAAEAEDSAAAACETGDENRDFRAQPEDGAAPGGGDEPSAASGAAGAPSAPATPTVAWYHFNEGEAGTSPAGGKASIENAASPDSLMGAAYGQKSWALDLLDESAYLPMYAQCFPSCVSWYDPATGARGEDGRGLFMRTQYGSGNGESSIVLVDDDAKLHCTNITVEFMAKLALPRGKKSLDHWAHMVVMRNSSSANVKAWGIMVTKGGFVELQLETRDATGAAPDAEKSISKGLRSSVSGLTDGKWHHVAFTYDGATVRLFVDYVERASMPWTNAIDYNGECKGRLCIGGNDMANYGHWQGYIDEVRISSEALGPEKFLRVGGVDTHASDADTAVYLPFDSFEFSRDRFFGPEFRPILHNAACSTNANLVSLSLSTIAAGIYPRLDTGAAAVVSNKLHAGIFAREPVFNAGCWTFTNNLQGAAYEGKSRFILIDDYSRNGMRHLISSGDFTAEFFLKVPKTPARISRILCENAGSKGAGSLVVSVDESSLRCHLLPAVQFERYEAGAIEAASGIDFKVPVKRIVGGWHHVALAVDRARRSAKFYLDGEIVGSAADFELASSVSSKPGHDTLKIGDGYGGNNVNAFENLSIDEFRITRRALSPQAFLTAGGPVDHAEIETTRAWMRFEGGLGVGPDAAEAGGGRAPETVSFSTDVPGRRILCRDDGYVSERNESSLSFSASGRALFGRNILLERGMTSQTVEFFMKGTRGAAVAWAYFVRLYSNDTAAEIGGERTWSIGYKDAEGHIYVLMDNGPRRSDWQTFYPDDGVSLADGRWHHVAVTFEPDGKGNTLCNVYVDYRRFGETKTFNGLMGAGAIPGRSCMAMGNNFNGLIDEVRISKGVLRMGEMMCAEKPGMTIILY